MTRTLEPGSKGTHLEESHPDQHSNFVYTSRQIPTYIVTFQFYLAGAVTRNEIINEKPLHLFIQTHLILYMYLPKITFLMHVSSKTN